MPNDVNNSIFELLITIQNDKREFTILIKEIHRDINTAKYERITDIKYLKTTAT